MNHSKRIAGFSLLSTLVPLLLLGLVTTFVIRSQFVAGIRAGIVKADVDAQQLAEYVEGYLDCGNTIQNSGNACDENGYLDLYSASGDVIVKRPQNEPDPESNPITYTLVRGQSRSYYMRANCSKGDIQVQYRDITSHNWSSLFAGIPIFCPIIGSTPDPTPTPFPTPFPSGNCVAMGTSQQTDRKIVVVGYCGLSQNNDMSWLVARFNADGSPDTSFGTTGRVLTRLTSYTGETTPDTGQSAYWAKIQPDGKIVVGGNVYYNKKWEPGEAQQAGALGPHKHFFTVAVARYLPDGTLDTSFSDDGIFYTMPATNPERRLGFHGFAVSPSGAVDISGKILLAAHGAWLNRTALLRLLPDGTIDTAYGTQGFTAPLAFTPKKIRYANMFSDLALHADGSATVSGYALTRYGVANYHEGLLAKFTSTGAVDSSFGGGTGYVLAGRTAPNIKHFFTPLALQTDGSLITFGYSYNKEKAYTDNGNAMILFRTNGSGNPDTLFGSSGIVRDVQECVTPDCVLGRANNMAGAAQRVLVQPDGKILTLGANYVSDNLGLPIGSTDLSAEARGFLSRYNSDGQRDLTFGNNGIRRYKRYGYHGGFLLQPDGKIIVVNWDLTIARFLPDGTFEKWLSCTPEGVVTCDPL